MLEIDPLCVRYLKTVSLSDNSVPTRSKFLTDSKKKLLPFHFHRGGIQSVALFGKFMKEIFT